MKILKWSRDFSTARCPILPLLNRKANKSHFNSPDDSSDVFLAVYRSFLSDKMKLGLETRVQIAVFSTFHAMLS